MIYIKKLRMLSFHILDKMSLEGVEPATFGIAESYYKKINTRRLPKCYLEKESHLLERKQYYFGVLDVLCFRTFSSPLGFRSSLTYLAAERLVRTFLDTI